MAAMHVCATILTMDASDWRIECDSVVFERIRSERSFQQILALTRAVNSLQFVFDAFVSDALDVSLTARRSRINSFLFGSAILYEGLLLVERMNKEFRNHDVFMQGLHALLKDPIARTLRDSHMGPARNFAVFHYDSEELGRILKDASVHECEFMEGRGTSTLGCYFPFTDTLATELWAGRAGSEEEFYKNLGKQMGDTRDLAKRFIESSHRLILRCVRDWKFTKKKLA